MLILLVAKNARNNAANKPHQWSNSLAQN